MIKQMIAAVALVTASTATIAATYVDAGTVTVAGSGNGTFGPGTSGAGAFDLFAITGRDDTGYALGGGSGAAGQIVVSFSTGSVVDGAGNDFSIYDNFGFNEGLIVEASADGLTYVSVATTAPDFSPACDPGAPCVTSLDLAGSGLSSAKFFRLTANQGQCVFNYPECYDLDTLEALNFRAAVPEPASWAMMIGGFALLGGTVRRRRTGIAFA